MNEAPVFTGAPLTDNRPAYFFLRAFFAFLAFFAFFAMTASVVGVGESELYRPSSGLDVGVDGASTARMNS